MFSKQTRYRDSPRRGWDPVEGYHSMVYSRQKEPAERAFLRLRVRERGGDGILVGGGFVRDLLEGLGNEREWGPLFLFFKKKQKVESGFVRVRCAEGRRGGEQASR